ncbi:hypothetical protein [Motilibacter aurantiacus]|uniref:hypothetical protein n=1 Tax=Motilibacter aurantiacus TaxID=2714955 RepID=UPI00140BCC2D|nr:hypothetical protein [Motilibacter aurantiacus]NHC44400.1 hypothetical protein [Motilibacter aurantiacus]
MARRDDPDDIDALLAEVDRTLGDAPSGGAPRAGKGASPVPSGRSPEPRARGSLPDRARTAALSAAAGAAVVFALFAFLPFLGAWSGAAGAFLATFVAVFLLRRR